MRRLLLALALVIASAANGQSGPIGTHALDGSDSPGTVMTTKGDLMTRSATIMSRLPVGSDGCALVADSTQALGLRYSCALTPTSVTITAADGSTWVHAYASETITLSTVGTTTDSSASLLPANAIIEAVVARVSTTVTTATSWQLGDSTWEGRFTAAQTGLTAGTTVVGLVHVDQSGSAGPRQTSAAKIRITTVGTPGAGAIKITVFYRQFTPPTS